MDIKIDGPAGVAEQCRDQFRVIAESDDLGGRLFIVEFVIQAGSEPPLRRHRHEDLLLFVLDGRLTFHVDGQQHPASPGGSVIVPKGSAHGFTVESRSARLLMVLSPAGAEELISQLFGSPKVHSGLSGDDSCEVIDQLVTTAARYDVEITGPPPCTA